ncbi:hypothetical protein [Halosegnis marinus]|uniref:DUF4203 domain-containing protein n=1 Tax=Halosegnis marinus TaxID=3034023 RepID=A0ABD5ZKF4_9EURY|nr:hypothetical protein [Halosegnis sp. DT85]
MPTDWRAVLAGAGAALAYLALLALAPGFDAVRLAGVPLVLATGLVAGAAAGLAADRGPGPGAWHGLLAGSLGGAAFAVTLVYVFSANEPYGVFHGLNYVVATSAADFPVVATHGRAVVAGIAGTGWTLIAALGIYAGHAAPRREGGSLIEE